MKGSKIKNRLELAKYFGTLGFKKGAEIGVKDGHFSEILCQNIPGLKLTCVDIWPKTEIYQTAIAKLSPYEVTFIKKSSAEAAGEVPDASLDFVFIDANHLYESVKLDIELWSKKIRPGGIISGHDYLVFPYSGNRGVIEAVDEYTKDHGYHLVIVPWDRTILNRDDRKPCWYFFKNTVETKITSSQKPDVPREELYLSYLPILTRIVEQTEGPILELGMGFSTMILDMMCRASERPLVSYDNDPKWYEKYAKYASSFHLISLTNDWEKIDIESTHWSVAFIDHRPALRRRVEAKRLRDNADYLILHDSEPEIDKYYRYSDIYPLFKYRFDYTKCKPYTTVLSNFKELKL